MAAKKPESKKCAHCGACKECGAGGQPQIVPMPYPVPQPYPVYPRPFTPYQPRWISQPQTWGIGATSVTSAQPWNTGGGNYQ